MRDHERIHFDITAWHEAGHLVAALYEGRPVGGVALSDAEPGNGLTLYRGHGPTSIDPSLGPGNARLAWVETLARTRSRIAISLAGPLAEAKALGTPMRSIGASSDFRMAYQMTDRLTLLWDHFGAWQGFEAPEPLTMLNRERIRVRRWLGRSRIWSLVSRYAEALQAEGVLNRAAVLRILDEHSAPSGQASLDFWSRPDEFVSPDRQSRREPAASTPYLQARLPVPGAVVRAGL